MRRTRKSILLSIVAGVAVAMPGNAGAWGPEGHSLIVDAAFTRLSQHTLDQIAAIRAAASIHHQYDHPDSRTHQMRHEDCRDDSIEALANWADCIRYESDHSYSDTAPNHFDDVPWCPMPALDYCEDKCGSASLQTYVATLRNPDAPPADRLRALAFVLHIVGDLHQPLHTITNGTPQNGDNGGNGVHIAVSFGGRDFTNLHSLWDGGEVIAAFAPGENRLQAIQRAARRGAARWRTEAGGRTAAQAPQWVAASHVIAVEAYNRLRPRPGCGQHPVNVSLGDGYIQHFGPPVRGQLARAAVRLADVLNDALG